MLSSLVLLWTGLTKVVHYAITCAITCTQDMLFYLHTVSTPDQGNGNIGHDPTVILGRYSSLSFGRPSNEGNNYRGAYLVFDYTA